MMACGIHTTTILLNLKASTPQAPTAVGAPARPALPPWKQAVLWRIHGPHPHFRCRLQAPSLLQRV
ncbi:hypothetical protein A1O1_02082 [Capronia coronata CBS 617.96]|uniref:Uncharacterized protein n=1 Tax=Capronia coronata CBS 617.96 TaxID=1182541 RepID=W9YVH6_9EURO|nr:uncharacterized protein A1O1_02082 [Capronia coronata CBS 617.96]EXJ93690.1 hypothetical protein A1O1_02082 [Capronia coronata CBS 617.96]